MPRLFNTISHKSAYCAVYACLDHKWRRNDVLTHIEEWTGYSRYELYENELEHGALEFRLKYEILDELAAAAEDMVAEIEAGQDPDFDPVSIRPRPDGATGKVRDVAYLCIRHQILGHIVKIGLEPLFSARIQPTQHASIPDKGQTGLARQVKRMLNRKLGITCFVKTDCTAAYASTQYSICIGLIRREIPRAKWIFACLDVLARYAPGGHLIIGGYLDAWLFNYVMSYALRYLLSLKKSRRGNDYPMVIRAVTFMDDALLLGRSKTALCQVVKKWKTWMWDTYHIALRQTTGVIRLWNVEDEKRHKRAKTPAARGCPRIDMGGYLIAHTHIVIRRRNVPKMLRCFRRAWLNELAAGTVKRQRAGQIIARNGMAANADSERMRHKYHVFELMRLAKRVQAHWARDAQKRRRERLIYVCQKHRKQCATLCGAH